MLRIPYGKSYLECEIKGAEVLRSGVDGLKPEGSGPDIVRRAMESPIGSPRLRELARGKNSCVLIISDHTRPVPSRDIIPNMLRELREGSPDIDLTLLVATGFHRGTTQEELRHKLGEELAENLKIHVHDCRDSAQNVQIGVLPSGAPCVINRLAAETQLLIAEGFIEPHFFAGFSGGRKSVLPGICDEKTVLGNHRSSFIDSPRARTGILDGNPIHEDMLAAAKMAGLRYIVNVVIDEEKRTLAAFAGDPELAHRRGCEFLSHYCEVKARPADLVISSNGGAPLDQNIYQCVKGLTAAEAACAPGATIIMCAECGDGHGGGGFYRALRDCENPAELYARQLATPWDRTEPDQWESQILARILMKHRVIMVTRPELSQMVCDMKMLYAQNIGEALELAGGTGGKRVAVIPNGVSITVK